MAAVSSIKASPCQVATKYGARSALAVATVPTLQRARGTERTSRSLQLRWGAGLPTLSQMSRIGGLSGWEPGPKPGEGGAANPAHILYTPSLCPVTVLPGHGARGLWARRTISLRTEGASGFGDHGHLLIAGSHPSPEVTALEVPFSVGQLCEMRVNGVTHVVTEPQAPGAGP